MITIVLADDHAVVREGLRALLAAEADLRVVGEAADGPTAVDLTERLAPDVILLDLMMPGLSGVAVAEQVAKRAPATRVVVLSMQSSEAYVLAALKQGATGFVLKDAGAAEVKRAVREAAAGRRYLSPPLSERAIAAYVESAAARAPDPWDLLTAREREVLKLAAEGTSNPAIGQRLGISPRTAEVHRANAMHKLGLKNQTDLVKFALRRGLIPAE